MNPSARFLACVVGGWLLLANATAVARTLPYPNTKEASPLLRFELPDGWKAHQSASEFHGLECQSDQGIGLLVTFMEIPAPDATRNFASLARSIIRLDKLNRKARLIATGNDQVGDRLPVEFVRYADKVDGDPLVLTLYRLQTHRDTAVLIIAIEFPDEPDSDKRIVQKILANIR